MNVRLVETGGIELYTESFGDSDRPCILLIMGATASMIWWDEEFCKKLAATGRFVIRYDNRDTGKSTSKSALDYDIVDMADDAAAILDAYGIEKAHIVGVSLGGMIAQILALRHTERIMTITALASGIFADRADLPAIDQKVLDYHAAFADVDLSDRKNLIRYLAEGWRVIKGSKNEFDEARIYRLAEQDVDRANNISSMFNHAQLAGGEKYYDRIKDINVPVLIIHGTEDIVLPKEHAMALAEEVENSQLFWIEGAGHEIHGNDWNFIIEKIEKHTR